MSMHRQDSDITAVKTYFNAVIDWASAVFSDVMPEMRVWSGTTLRGAPQQAL